MANQERPYNHTTVVVTQQQQQQQQGCSNPAGGIGCLVLVALVFLFAAIGGEYGPGWQVLAWIVLILVVVGLLRLAYIKLGPSQSEKQPQESTQAGSTEATGDSENYGWGGGNFTSDSEQPLSTVEAAAVDPQAISRPDVFEDLQQLARLRDAGIITNEEFEAKKRDLLDRI